MVECLSTLGRKPKEVAYAITKFPLILSHSVEEKLCPLLAFFQALGVPETHLHYSLFCSKFWLRAFLSIECFPGISLCVLSIIDSTATLALIPS